MVESVTKKERSRAYPVMPLSEALARIKSINENLGLKGQYNRETIATGMGYAGLNGASARAVAALTHYGLLDREKDQYSLSDVAKKYLVPVEDNDQATAMHTAALSPTLFSEIYETFKGQVIPKQFVNRLIQEFGIQQKAAPEVERIFRETMSVAGILQANNILSSEGVGSARSVAPPDGHSEEKEDPDESGNITHSSRRALTDKPSDYLSVKLPSGLIISYRHELASAFAFGVFGAKLKELDEAVANYSSEEPVGSQNE